MWIRERWRRDRVIVMDAERGEGTKLRARRCIA